jgi:serine/threonine protein kinase
MAVEMSPWDDPRLATIIEDPLLGVTIGGRYLVREALSDRGRLRQVAAEEVGTGRAVRVTVLSTGELDEVRLARFRAAATRVAQLAHPALAPLCDFGRERDGLVYAVEEGETFLSLAQELSIKGVLQPLAALALACDLLDGLDHLHGAGLAHGRLSPRALRLVFGRDGVQTLQIPTADLALRELCELDDPGADAYAPQGSAPPARADLHAVVLVLLEMLQGASARGVEPSLLERGGLPRGQAERLADLLGRALRGGAGGFSTAGELRRGLEGLAGRSRFGRYELLRRIGVGGMGEVFLARVEGEPGVDVERLCVIKTIRTGFAQSRAFVERFLAEARVLSALSHGNIVPVYDVGKVGTALYIAMEYVAGKDLAAIIERAAARRTRIPLPLALFVGRELANGLAYAHRARIRGSDGLIHRDVSPENVLVSYEGQVRLIDFGIFRGAGTETDEGLVVGKLGYMSPEQAEAGRVDARTDIYSTGLVLYELLTGRRFFEGESFESVMAQLRSPQPSPPSTCIAGIPDEIDRIFARATAPRPEDRYARAGQLRDDLSAALARLAPRTSAEEVGVFVRSLFPERAAEEGDTGLTAPRGGDRPVEIEGVSTQQMVSLVGARADADRVAEAGASGASTSPRAQDLASRPGAAASSSSPSPSSSPGPARVARGGRTRIVRAAIALSGLVALAAASGVILYEAGRRSAPREAPSLPRPRADQGPPGRAGSSAETVDPEEDGGFDDARPDDDPRPPRTARRSNHRPGEIERPRERHPCLLVVQGGPRGARLTLDGISRGVLPLAEPLELEPGKAHRILVRSGSLDPYDYRLTCKPGERLKLELKVR